MKIEMRYRWFWLRALLLLAVLLMTVVSCSSDDGEEVVPKLNIYVYAPDRAAVTRGEVVPTEEEALIHNLQIGVFRSSDPSKLVASLTLTDESQLQGLNSNKSASYSIGLSDRSFADHPEPVDVYVLANVGYNEYLGNVYSSNDLEEAVFNGGHFFSFTQGPAYQAVSTVPADKGVPMSGVARGKSVIDKNTVLHINDANVKLVRTVSKIRFVLSSLEGLKQLFVDRITLNKDMLYQKERFFLDGDHPSYWVEGAPFKEEVLLVKGDRVNPVVQIGAHIYNAVDVAVHNVSALSLHLIDKLSYGGVVAVNISLNYLSELLFRAVPLYLAVSPQPAAYRYSVNIRDSGDEHRLALAALIKDIVYEPLKPLSDAVVIGTEYIIRSDLEKYDIRIICLYHIAVLQCFEYALTCLCTGHLLYGITAVTAVVSVIINSPAVIVKRFLIHALRSDKIKIAEPLLFKGIA